MERLHVRHWGQGHSRSVQLSLGVFIIYLPRCSPIYTKVLQNIFQAIPCIVVLVVELSGGLLFMFVSETENLSAEFSLENEYI